MPDNLFKYCNNSLPITTAHLCIWHTKVVQLSSAARSPCSQGCVFDDWTLAASDFVLHYCICYRSLRRLSLTAAQYGCWLHSVCNCNEMTHGATEAHCGCRLKTESGPQCYIQTARMPNRLNPATRWQNLRKVINQASQAVQYLLGLGCCVTLMQ